MGSRRFRDNCKAASSRQRLRKSLASEGVKQTGPSLIKDYLGVSVGDTNATDSSQILETEQ